MADTPEEDDRTEEPTQKKLDDAIKRGDVPKSMEINTLFVLGGFTLALMILSGPVSRGLALDLRGFLMNAHMVPPDGAGFAVVGRHALLAGLVAIGLPAAMIAAAGLIGGGVQHRPLFTREPLRPQFSRLSPMKGFKRLFGREALVQFAKGLLKIAIVGTVATMVLYGERDRFEGLANARAGCAAADASFPLRQADGRHPRGLRLPRRRRRRLPAPCLAEAPAHVEA